MSLKSLLTLIEYILVLRSLTLTTTLTKCMEAEQRCDLLVGQRIVKCFRSVTFRHIQYVSGYECETWLSATHHQRIKI